MAGTDLELDVQYACEDPDLPAEADFRRWAAAALESRKGPAELCVRVVDEPEGRALNERYRAKDHATNVLSFPAELPPGVEAGLLGDLVICAPVLRREAAEQGKAETAHWAHLTVHGVLHLLGFDHRDGHEAQAMEALETRILAGLGFPDPYSMDTLDTGQVNGEETDPAP